MNRSPLPARSRLLRLSSALLIGCATIAAQPAFAQTSAGARSFAIAPQPLVDAMRDFSRATGIQVAYAAAIGTGVQSPGVSGSFAPAEALSRLLGGTGLSYRFTGANAVTLEPAPAADAGTVQLGPVRVGGDDLGGSGGYVEPSATGPVSGYVAKRTISASKTDALLIETPQAISVVTRDQMNDQNIQTVPQALRYAVGVVAEQRGVNSDALEYIFSRGFRVDEYWNGLRLPSTDLFAAGSFDPYMFERIEVVRGPASVLYGQTSPGGLVNFVSKRPTDDARGEVMLQTGSFNRIQGAFDLSGPLDDGKTLLYRMVANAYDVDSVTKYDGQRRIMLAPSFEWRPGEKTSLTLFGSYQSDPKAGAYDGVPAIGTVLPGPHISRKLFTGDPNANKHDKEGWSVGYEARHAFSDALSVEHSLRYTSTNVIVRRLGVSGINAARTALTRTAYFHDGDFDALTTDTRATLAFDTGPLSHRLTIGFDYQHGNYSHLYIGNAAATPLDIANPQYGIAVPTPTFIFGTSSRDLTDQTGVYAQDQMHLGRLVLLLGGRQDWTKAKITSLKFGTVTRRDPDKFTWRVGAIYPTAVGLAPYASYSTSFQPVVGLNSDGSEQKPTAGEQYEVGIKYQPAGVNAFITLSAFHLTQTNVVASNGMGLVSQTGEVRSKGIEAEGHASLANGLDLTASYSLNDLINSKSIDLTILGKRPYALPRQQAALWLSYDLPAGALAGLNIGGGARYIGRSWGDPTNTLRVPGYTLFDLAARYDLGALSPSLDRWQVSVTASNLFDKAYISSCVYTVCTYGPSRNILANVRYRW